MATRKAPTRPRRARKAAPRGGRRAGATAGPRADWRGHIGFGLVEIPVTPRTAEQRKNEPRFKLIDKRDRSPVGNLHVSKETGREVPWEQIVKGYEHEKGEFVLLDESELRELHPEASRVIQITDFVEADAIDPAYFAEPYLVLPGRSKGNRAYALLRDALARSGKVGIATVTLRTRQHLAALTTRGPLLALILLRWAHELLDVDAIAPAGASEHVTGKELDMAEQLVESMASDWKPEKYKDTYREDVLALIQRKVKSGRTGPVVRAAPERDERVAPVLDLMPLLERSLGARGRHASRARKSA